MRRNRFVCQLRHRIPQQKTFPIYLVNYSQQLVTERAVSLPRACRAVSCFAHQSVAARFCRVWHIPFPTCSYEKIRPLVVDLFCFRQIVDSMFSSKYFSFFKKFLGFRIPIIFFHAETATSIKSIHDGILNDT